MTIKPGNDARHFHVTDPCVSPEYLLGCTRRKGKKNEYLVEANYLNMHQLGIPFKVTQDDLMLLWAGEGLFEYQKADVTRMLRQRHIFNANRMGYGKTVEAIAALNGLGVQNALILAPKAVLQQWSREIDKWWPVATPRVLVKPAVEDRIAREHIVITNYEALRNERLVAKLRTHTWDAIVCDESHRLKNRKSKNWKTVVDLPAHHKMCLSGTPILRRIDDLWAQWFFLNWRFAGLSYWNFVEFFCETKQGAFGTEIGVLSSDPKKVELLNWLVNLVCIRNEDMALTVGKRQHIIDLKLEDKQKTLYKAARDLCFETLPEELTIQNGMAHVLRLRQLTSCPQQFAPGTNNIKFEWIKDAVADNPDLKIVVYSIYSTTILALAKELGSKCVTYVGSNGDLVNQRNKQTFIEDKNVQVLGGTIGSLGTGVDGLQKVCSTVVFIDKDWSPEINSQAEDRLNRYGQQQLVNCYYLECVGTMDRHVSRINLSKAADIRAALMDEEI